MKNSFAIKLLALALLYFISANAFAQSLADTGTAMGVSSAIDGGGGSGVAKQVEIMEQRAKELHNQQQQVKVDPRGNIIIDDKKSDDNAEK